MARSTGPILAIGAITIVNGTILHGQPMDWRIPIATGAAAAAFALMEHGWEQGTVGLAWLALVSVLFVRLKPTVPSPVESLLAFWEGAGRSS
jgi:hypothetical protein